MIIYALIRRAIYGPRPDQVRDYTENHYATKELAEAEVFRILGEKATCEDWTFFDVYKSPDVPNVEYIIDPIVVQTK